MTNGGVLCEQETEPMSMEEVFWRYSEVFWRCSEVFWRCSEVFWRCSVVKHHKRNRLWRCSGYRE